MGKVKEQMMEAQEKDIHNEFNPDSAFLESQSQCDEEQRIYDPVVMLILDIQDLERDIEILQGQHDCHLSPEDGCETCEQLFEMGELTAKLKKIVNSL